MTTPSAPLTLRLLEHMTLHAEQSPRTLPKSRKTRALLVYLALEARPIRRDLLCDLLWEDAADPRGALRWSLSRLRPSLDSGSGQALQADAHTVALDPALISVDVLQADALLAGNLRDIDDHFLSDLEAALASGFPAGIDHALGNAFQLWMGGQRESLRERHRRVLAELSARARSPQSARALARRCVLLDPLDTAANLQLLTRTFEVDGHAVAQTELEQMRARYRAEGASDHALVARWRSLDGSAALALPDRPSVAVLGFEPLGGLDDGVVLAEGLAADLTLSLGTMRELFVTARASAARFSSASGDLTLAGRLLGVRYVVHGTTQRWRKRLRVGATLIDAHRNMIVWTEQYERPLDDLFALQDELTKTIASAIGPAISRAESDRVRSRPAEDLNAWECYHRAIWHCFHFAASHTEQAHRLLRQALRLDPDFARAHAGLSFTHYARAFLDSVPDPDAEIGAALEHGQHAVELDPHDAMSHWTFGRARFLARDHDAALHSVARSLQINANFAHGHYALGFIRAHSATPDIALPELDAAERLSPLDPMLFAVEGTRAISLALTGDFEAAARWSTRATSEPNAHFHMPAIAAACLALSGRLEQAREYARRALQEHPGYCVAVFERSFPHQLAGHQALFARAMISAGIPPGAPCH